MDAPPYRDADLLVSPTTKANDIEVQNYDLSKPIVALATPTSRGWIHGSA